MLTVTIKDLTEILNDFGIESACRSFTELQRYDYEEYDPTGRSVRLIIKAETEDGGLFVVRLKNEDDVTPEIVEAQSAFAAALLEHGIETPRVFASNGHYARMYEIGGYEVTAAVEWFVSGELSSVDARIAEKTGRLLARMHNIAERADIHVENEVLFDPLKDNELFRFEAFSKHKDLLCALDAELYSAIEIEYARREGRLRALEGEPRFAVQGDISDCNLYLTENGELGVFDFNRSGDSVLFFDAAMQAIFEARLMDYPPDIAADPEPVILPAFLRGYNSVRPFTREQRELFSDVYALVSAFWLCDLKWNGESLEKDAEAGNEKALRDRMKTILFRLTHPIKMPI